MKTENIDELITRSFADSISENETTELRKWVELSPENKNHYITMKSTWEILTSSPARGLETAEEGWELLEKKLFSTSSAHIYQLEKKRRNSTNIFMIPASVAAVFLAAFGVYYFSLKHQPETEYVTDKNETKTIFLPDSSVVYLNSSSRILFSKNEYSTDSRKVKLVGEAFFEVKHNLSNPFSVETGNSRVEVLGTKFNLKFKNKKTELRVKEGKVAFSSLNDKIKNSVEVTAGYKSQCDGLRDAELPSRMEINISDAWRNNVLISENKTLVGFLNMLSEEFSVKIVIKDDVAMGKKITSQYKKDNLDLILTDVCRQFNLWYEKKENTITLHQLK